MTPDIQELKARAAAVPAGEMVAVYAETVRGLIEENERLAASEARAEAAEGKAAAFDALEAIARKTENADEAIVYVMAIELAKMKHELQEARAAIAAMRPAPKAEG